MGVPHFEKVLKIANNYLPSVEYRYNALKQEVNSLREQKSMVYNQVTEESNRLEYYRVACKGEIDNFERLRDSRMKDEALASSFRKNSSYIKIEKTIRKKLRNRLLKKLWDQDMVDVCMLKGFDVKQDNMTAED
ncbi:MAG: hypothetical protein WCF23_20580 [Candidatus Nitrosopolaris sp.]